MKIVIAGAGAVGTHLSTLLSTENHDCVLIDDDENRLGGIDSKLDIMALNASPTSIQTLNVTPEKQNESTIIYNLNGQRLSAPQKGINIINGKKVVIK